MKEVGGYTIGRLDSRYKGIDRQLFGARPDYNSENNFLAAQLYPGYQLLFTRRIEV